MKALLIAVLGRTSKIPALLVDLILSPKKSPTHGGSTT
jgi:hypothetical protein